MGTGIGARNLADPGRYNQLPEIAARMGLDTTRDRSLWRDQALVELNLAVLHSFETAGVTITDHHTESRRFLTHLAREERAGRICPADWTWIVPPISGVGHRGVPPLLRERGTPAQLTPGITGNSRPASRPTRAVRAKHARNMWHTSFTPPKHSVMAGETPSAEGRHRTGCPEKVVA